jgi:hypothetical protein
MTNRGAENTVLPQLERALASAVSGRIEGSGTGVGRGRIRLRRHRVAAIALAGLLVAGTAVATTGSWHPSIGDRSNPGPPTLSYGPVTRADTEVLGVLRRQPTALDRGPAVRETLHNVDRYHFAGVRPESVRFLAHGVGGQAAILVSVEEFEGKTDHPLCVFQPVTPGGSAFGCYSLAEIRADLAMAVYGAPDRSIAYGLVPDGVAAVTAHFSRGRSRRGEVVNNYFHIGWGAGAGAGGHLDPEAGWKSLDFENAAGKVIHRER